MIAGYRYGRSARRRQADDDQGDCRHRAVESEAWSKHDGATGLKYHPKVDPRRAALSQ
jgi:hypothetical protein